MYEKIKELCRHKGISVNMLEKDLGFGKGSLCKIDKTRPSQYRLEKIADYFNVDTDYLLGKEKGSTYYLDPETAEYAQFLLEHPEYKVLFDASKKVRPEDINRALKAVGIFIDE